MILTSTPARTVVLATLTIIEFAFNSVQCRIALAKELIDTASF